MFIFLKKTVGNSLHIVAFQCRKIICLFLKVKEVRQQKGVLKIPV